MCKLCCCWQFHGATVSRRRRKLWAGRASTFRPLWAATSYLCPAHFCWVGTVHTTDADRFTTRVHSPWASVLNVSAFKSLENWRQPHSACTTWMKNIHDDLSSLDLGTHKARDLAWDRPLCMQTDVCAPRYVVGCRRCLTKLTVWPTFQMLPPHAAFHWSLSSV